MNKYRVKNCPAISFAGGCQNGEIKVWDCQDCTDCVLKQIVEKCSKAHGQIIGYEKGKIYDGKNLIEANLPLATINPLAKEILSILDIQEVE